jgi:hypothetical protein
MSKIDVAERFQQIEFLEVNGFVFLVFVNGVVRNPIGLPCVLVILFDVKPNVLIDDMSPHGLLLVWR